MSPHAEAVRVAALLLAVAGHAARPSLGAARMRRLIAGIYRSDDPLGVAECVADRDAEGRAVLDRRPSELRLAELWRGLIRLTGIALTAVPVLNVVDCQVLAAPFARLIRVPEVELDHH